MRPTTTFPETLRFYDLDGGLNFRDLGGYATEDGRNVIYGHIFRSGMMTNVQPAGAAQLRALNIKTVCDLRARNERMEHPNHWVEGSDIHQCVREDQDHVGDLTAFYKSIESAPNLARETMISGYRKIPYTLVPSYRKMFERLLEGHAPLVFHCAGGKDRTGIAAGLLLTALGVPRETILRDYQATDRAYDQLFEVMRIQTAGHVDITLDLDTWLPLMAADPTFLLTSFEEMEKNEGSVQGYLHRHVGIDDAAMRKLRDLYTA